MPSASTLTVFAVATLALLLIPGPAVLYVVTRSVEHGRRVGLASVLGVHVGTTVHVVAAALGLSALLVSSAAAFSVIKYAGAAYLIVIGVRRLLTAHGTGGAAPAGEAGAPRRAFAQGVVVNVLNPKTALFFLAFLPQFLDPARGPLVPQVLLLGATFITLGVICDGSYALAASYVVGRWRDRPGRGGPVGGGPAGGGPAGGGVARAERLSGLVYVGLGVLAAVTPRHPAHH